MPRHETASDWFQRCHRRQQQHQQQQRHHHQPQQHPQEQSSFSQVLHDLLFLKSHQPIDTGSTAFATTTTTTTTTAGCITPHHASASSASSSSLMIVLEGCSIAKSWIMIHMIREWITTTPYSVLVINGEAKIQLGLLPLLLGTSTATGQSSSAPPPSFSSNTTSATNNDHNQQDGHHQPPSTIHDSTIGHDQQDYNNNHESNQRDPSNKDTTTTTTTTIRNSSTTPESYLQRIHFGTGSVALLELIRYSCAATATNNNNHPHTPSTTTTPLLVLWDEYPDDPDMTRQLGRLIQSFPQLSVVVAGKWSGGVAQRIQVERRNSESWMATVAGKRYDFRITLEGIG